MCFNKINQDDNTILLFLKMGKFIFQLSLTVLYSTGFWQRNKPGLSKNCAQLSVVSGSRFKYNTSLSIV